MPLQSVDLYYSHYLAAGSSLGSHGTPCPLSLSPFVTVLPATSDCFTAIQHVFTLHHFAFCFVSSQLANKRGTLHRYNWPINTPFAFQLKKKQQSEAGRSLVSLSCFHHNLIRKVLFIVQKLTLKFCFCFCLISKYGMTVDS